MEGVEKFRNINKIYEINLTKNFNNFSNDNRNYGGKFSKNPIEQKKNYKLIGLVNTFYEYVQYTKLNGMHFLSRGITKGFSRVLWSLIELIVFVLSVYIMIELYHKYLELPTRMIRAKPIPILKVPYPAITICHPQNVMDYKIDKFLAKIKLPPTIDTTVIKQILPLLGGINERQWTAPNITQFKQLDNIFKFNNLTIYQAISDLGATCEDFIIKCQWNGKDFPCFQNESHLSWQPSTTHLGVCCSFNYHSKNVSYTPFSSNTFGIHGGLSVIGSGTPQIADGKSGAIFSAGFMILVHYPKDFPSESAQFTLLEVGAETYVDIYPTDTRCSKQVLRLPIEQRKCVTSDDVEFLKYIEYSTTAMGEYRQPECILNCYRHFVYRECKCHPYYLPRGNFTIRECDIMDIPCFAENYVKLRQIHCHCLPSCSDVTYKLSTYWSSFDAHHLSVNQLYLQANLSKNDFIVHIYLTGQMALANRKMIIMSWISLLANLGGCFNLGFGLSIISIFEVFVVVFIRYRTQVNMLKNRSDTSTTRLQIFPATERI